jgi:23S rRNA U2552 (ribose-2'-O)-methylase RlmE/FtsJ
MTYFLLPRTFSKTFTSIEYTELPTDTSPILVSGTLSQYLSSLKEKITPKEKLWDIYKKYTNPYEYIHTPIPTKKRSISKIKPISRSYFKMVEITLLFDLLNKYQDTSIRSFHLAEGPGGFIEALATIRNNTLDSYYGMTLIDKAQCSNIPTWKKSKDFLGRFTNVILESGSDNTGNILILENLRYCKEKYESSMDIITGDGGFDFSTDFNHQEIAISKLLYGQFAFAITMQKKGGHFILKIFDSFMKHTLDIIYLLSSFYQKVYIIKPKTSRYANSEKYIVCMGFLYDSTDEYYPFIESGFIQMMKTGENPCQFLNLPLPYYFIQKIEEYNSIFGQKQIQNIYYTLSLIGNQHKNERIDALINTNIQKSVDWCIKYNIHYHTL